MRVKLIDLWKAAGEPLLFFIYLSPESSWPLHILGVKFDAAFRPRFITSVFEDEDLDPEVMINSISWRVKGDLGAEIEKSLSADEIIVDDRKRPW